MTSQPDDLFNHMVKLDEAGISREARLVQYYRTPQEIDALIFKIATYLAFTMKYDDVPPQYHKVYLKYYFTRKASYYSNYPVPRVAEDRDKVFEAVIERLQILKDPMYHMGGIYGKSSARCNEGNASTVLSVFKIGIDLSDTVYQ